ncbi:MAG: hypothetical protein L0216_00465 [Planctomycetales bacterium]|nr:hypothetical protein [Planctomycetales bacterium]
MKMHARTTFRLDPRLLRALKIKSATVSRSMSDLMNEALKLSLREDASDLAAFEQTRRERVKPLEQVLKEMRRDGLL